MILEFRSKGHARIHMDWCFRTAAFFKAAIGKHGHLSGYVDSLRGLADEIQQAREFIEQ